MIHTKLPDQSSRLIAIAAIGSLSLLVAAIGLQYLDDLWPCELCIWQRWFHALAAISGLIALRWFPLAACMVAGLAVATGAAVAFYHSGVEFGLWEGPASCSAQSLDAADIGQLLDFSVSITSDSVIDCAEVQWKLLGLSMAVWNFAISAALTIIWFMAALRYRQGR